MEEEKKNIPDTPELPKEAEKEPSESFPVEDHDHDGVNSKKVDYNDLENAPSQISGRLYMSTTQNVDDSSATLVNFDTQDFASGITVNLTNKSFTILTAGKYLVSAIINYNATVDAKNYAIMIYKGATPISNAYMPSSGTTKQVAPHITDILNLAVGDVITIYTIHGAGVAQTITNSVSAGGNPSFFTIVKV